MSTTALFFGSNTGTTKAVAELIRARLGEIDIFDVDYCGPEELVNYDNLIMGVPTWDLASMQPSWRAFLANLEGMNLRGKKVALFGLGDAEEYPDTFVDAMGDLYDALISHGAIVVGRWPTQGYDFTDSRAVLGGKFVGLPLDMENQAQLIGERIDRWTSQLRKEFMMSL